MEELLNHNLLEEVLGLKINAWKYIEDEEYSTFHNKVIVINTDEGVPTLSLYELEHLIKIYIDTNFGELIQEAHKITIRYKEEHKELKTKIFETEDWTLYDTKLIIEACQWVILELDKREF